MADRDDRRSSRYSDDDRGRDRGRDDGRSRDRGRDDDRGSRSRDRDDDDRSSERRGGGRRFEYQRRDPSETKRRSEMGAQDYDRILKDGIKMWKPNDGDNRIRILPPTWKGAKHFGLDIYVNYGVGPDRSTFLSLSKMKGERDPIAEELDAARKDGDEKYVKDLTPKRRVLVYLIDRDHEREGVQAWAMPWTVDRDLVKVTQDKTTGEVLEIDHPDEGYDVTFEKKGAKDRTEYLGVSIARRSSALGDDRWLEFAQDNPLPEQLQYFSYDHIAKVFGGGGSRSRDRDDDDRGSDRGRDRDDDRGERGRSRDDDRGSRGFNPSKLDWAAVHEMTRTEMEDLIDAEKLKISPRSARDDDELADWICEELNLSKPANNRRRPDDDDDDKGRGGSPTRRRVVDDDDDDDSARRRDALRRRGD